MRLQPLAGDPRPLPRRPAARGPLGRSPQHRLRALRRHERRELRRRRGGGEPVAGTAVLRRAHAASARRRLAPAGEVTMSAAAKRIGPLGAVPVEPGLVEFRVWAPAAQAGPARRRPPRAGRERLLRRPPGSRPRRPLPVRRRREDAGRSVLALAARRAARRLARARHRHVRMALGPRRRSTRGARDLRAARRCVHAGRNLRRGGRAAARAGRARHHRRRADAGRDLPGRARLGLRRRPHLTHRTGPTAARRGSPASSTPHTRPGWP